MSRFRSFGDGTRNFWWEKIAERVRQKRNTLKEVIGWHGQNPYSFDLLTVSCLHYFLLFMYILYISIKKIPNQNSKNESVRCTKKSKKLWHTSKKKFPFNVRSKLACEPSRFSLLLAGRNDPGDEELWGETAVFAGKKQNGWIRWCSSRVKNN